MRFKVKRISGGFPARRNVPCRVRFCRMGNSRLKIIRWVFELELKDRGVKGDFA